MPYGEKSAYEAQAKLKGQSPAYKKSSGFKMKGISPLKHPHPEHPHPTKKEKTGLLGVVGGKKVTFTPEQLKNIGVE